MKIDKLLSPFISVFIFVSLILSAFSAEADPQIDVSPGQLNVTLSAGQTAVETLTISNTGDVDLEIQIEPAREISAQGNVSGVPSGEHPVIIESKASRAASGTGPPVIQGKGGPDTFGYTWIDSDESGGPVFDYIDITTRGNEVGGLGDDNFVGPFPIGFAFPFYGVDYTEFYITSNGAIGFGPPDDYDELRNGQLPNPDSPNNMICWLWDDLEPGDGNVYYETIGNNIVIQFLNYGEFFGPGVVNAEVILSSNGEITLQYQNFQNSFDTQSATVGIENADGSDGLLIVLNTNYLHDGLAVKILSPEIGWLSVNPSSSTLPVGASVNVTVTFNTLGLLGGNYSANINVSAATPANLSVLVPVNLTVTEPRISVSPTQIDVGQVTFGTTLTQALNINNLAGTGGPALTFSIIESGFSVQADPSGLITPPATGETGWDEDSQSQISVYQRVNIPAARQNLTPQSSTVNILWDDTHDNDGDDLFGNYFSFYDHLIGAGYNVVQLEVGAGPITSTTLSGYDIFVVVDPDLDFLTSEIDAVHDFVAQGGGLLIVGEPPQFNSQPTLDAILAPYGVQFTGGDFDDPAIGTFASHLITDGIQSVELGRHSSLNLSPPALALGFTNSGELVLGATEATGKVVVIADSSVMHNDWLPRADNLALMDNIFSWVITVGGEIPWLSVSPTAGAVEANGSLPITVSLNSTLSNGDYTAHLQIDRDDPSADPVSVQVKMTVIGASPEVATNPGSLDFGQVFTGEAMKKSLTVSNAGFDLLTVTDITSDAVVFTAEPTAFNLSPGNEKVVEVTFGPTSAGSVSAALTIASNDPDGALSVPLTGEGVVSSAISVTPGGLSESLFTGGTTAQSFTIANIGGSDLTFQIEVSEIAGVSYPPGEPAVIIETKGSDAASRTGPPVAQGRGGPDAFGYTWIDSDETGGPTFDYIDISGSGTRVSGLSDDNFAGPFPIGFSFSFYGIDYTDFYIASNGFIGFGPTSGYTSLSNVEIANPNTPNNIICWLWDDLHPRDGSVYYRSYTAVINSGIVGV